MFSWKFYYFLRFSEGFRYNWAYIYLPFGFGSYFNNAIKTMCKNGNCSIRLHAGTSPRLFLNRGVRQGCPISPYLFLLCTQLLTESIKLSPLKGISIADGEVIISQLADDTTLFLRDASQIPITIDLIKTFSIASGLHLKLKNVNCLLLRIAIYRLYVIFL